MLTEIGLHPGQEMILFRLWEADGLTQSELVEQLCVQPATVTKMLNRMVKNGLVERRGDPQDQRISRVYLTDQGRELQKSIEDAWDKLEQYTVATLSLEERVLLRRLLLQVQDNLNNHA
jgi:DNA-binding MarR family transcriptional regulator